MLLFGLNVLSFKNPVVTPVLDAQPTASTAQLGIVPESAKAEGFADGVPATRCMNVANWARVTLLSGSNVVGDVPVVIPFVQAHET